MVGGDDGRVEHDIQVIFDDAPDRCHRDTERERFYRDEQRFLLGETWHLPQRDVGDDDPYGSEQDTDHEIRENLQDVVLALDHEGAQGQVHDHNCEEYEKRGYMDELLVISDDGLSNLLIVKYYIDTCLALLYQQAL